mgnify:CR=1 FL=1
MNRTKGIIYPIGIGHSKKHITAEARELLATVDVVAGHYGFIEMTREHLNPVARIIDDREARNRATTFEDYQQNRVAACAAQALQGLSVAVLSGGDTGIWGQAGVLLEAGQAHDWAFDVQVVPGIPSMVAIGARLGAPLMNGFSVITVGDEDVPFEVIEKRLRGAALGGGTIVLYKLILENCAYPHFYPKEKYADLYPPEEKTRFRQRRTFEILSEHIPLDRPMAVVTDVHDQTSNYSSTTSMLGGDDGREQIVVTTFGRFLECAPDFRFFTTVVLGEAITKRCGDALVAPQWNYHWQYRPDMIDEVRAIPCVKTQNEFFETGEK